MLLIVFFVYFVGITCTLPNPPSMASFTNPNDSYTAGTTVTVTCDNSNDQVDWICNGYTGNWEVEPIACPTQSSGIIYLFNKITVTTTTLSIMMIMVIMITIIIIKIIIIIIIVIIIIVIIIIVTIQLKKKRI